jgi:predicted nucleic acid-binding protein
LTSSVENYYWDTCVFTAFLNNEQSAYCSYINDIAQFLDDAKNGKCVIFCSTITFAEIPKKSLVNAGVGSFSEFIADFRSVIIPVDATPRIMLAASHLRGMDYAKSGGVRKLQTPDAIHIATALGLEDTFGVKLEAFHTFDEGKAKGPNGKGLPILGFEAWCDMCRTDDMVRRVINMERCKPGHPTPRLPNA